MSDSLPVNGAIPPPPTTSPLVLNHPICVARLTIHLIQLVKVRIGDGVAFISGKTVFGGYLTNDVGDSRIIGDGKFAQTECGRSDNIHSIAQFQMYDL